RRPPSRYAQWVPALLRSGRQRSDGHMDFALRAAGELHLAIHQGKDRVVAAEADIGAGVPFGAALADEDVASEHGFAAELFDAEAPAFRVAPVAGLAAGFLVCQGRLLLRGRGCGGRSGPGLAVGANGGGGEGGGVVGMAVAG